MYVYTCCLYKKKHISKYDSLTFLLDTFLREYLNFYLVLYFFKDTSLLLPHLCQILEEVFEAARERMVLSMFPGSENTITLITALIDLFPSLPSLLYQKEIHPTHPT